MTTNSKILRWLMEGDPSIRWQVMRDLSETKEAHSIHNERQRIAETGWEQIYFHFRIPKACGEEGCIHQNGYQSHTLCCFSEDLDSIRKTYRHRSLENYCWKKDFTATEELIILLH